MPNNTLPSPMLFAISVLSIGIEGENRSWSAPVKAIETFDVTPEERGALLAGDVATLFEMGVHPFLLSFLTRYETSGLTTAVYSERIRKACDAWASNVYAEGPHQCGR